MKYRFTTLAIAFACGFLIGGGTVPACIAGIVALVLWALEA